MKIQEKMETPKAPERVTTIFTDEGKFLGRAGAEWIHVSLTPYGKTVGIPVDELDAWCEFLPKLRDLLKERKSDVF